MNINIPISCRHVTCYVIAVVTLGLVGGSPALAQQVRSSVVTSSALLTMAYSKFMVGCQDEAVRQRLWTLFSAAEKEAKRFAETPGHWVVLKEVVVVATGSIWTANGRIQLSPQCNPGTMFHEIFHTAFHKSVLHQGSDEGWGEAFCDAFRYMMEKQLLPQPQLVCLPQKVRRLRKVISTALLAIQYHRSRLCLCR